MTGTGRRQGEEMAREEERGTGDDRDRR